MLLLSGNYYFFFLLDYSYCKVLLENTKQMGFARYNHLAGIHSINITDQFIGLVFL